MYSLYKLCITGNYDIAKKLTTIIKPLSDVKNIIHQNQQIKKDVTTENREHLDISEENHNEKLFFYSEHQGNVIKVSVTYV